MASFHTTESSFGQVLGFLIVTAVGFALFWHMRGVEQTVHVTISLPQGAHLLVDDKAVKPDTGSEGVPSNSGPGPLYILELSKAAHRLIVVTADGKRHPHTLDLSKGRPVRVLIWNEGRLQEL